MHGEYHEWRSPALGRDMGLLVLGHAGARLLVFPTSGGGCREWIDRGMHQVLGDSLEKGWLQMFCVESVNGESWNAGHLHPSARAARHLAYDRYLLDEGRYRAHEGLIFFGYDVTDRLALEFEAGIITATFDKSPDDTSPLPARLEESGLSDVEAQLRWRWLRESDSRPELFNYFETVFPLSDANGLIGTSDWEFKLGAGIIKGFRWGTMAVRAAVHYTAEEDKFEIGEYAVEYLRRVSRGLRLFAMVEGSEDEIELVPEIQLHFGRHVLVKLNAGLGLTSKATDFAPETGIMFVIPTR